MRFSIQAFIFFAPFTTWLAVSTWLRFPVVLILLISVLSSARITRACIVNPLRIFEDREDLLLPCFICIACVSWALGYGAPRSLNHLMAFTFTLVFYFILFKFLARSAGLGSRNISSAIAWSSVCCCAIVIIEFLLLNLFDFQIRPFFVTGGPDTSNMDFFVRGIFRSVAGTAEEPGSMALFLNIYCPIGLFHFQALGKKRWFYLLFAMYALALIFLTSVAGIAICVSVALLAFIFRLGVFLKLLKRSLIPLCIILGALAYFIGNKLSLFFNDVARELMVKLVLSKQSSSASIRMETWQLALKNWWENPLFGMGPGYGVQSLGSGYHSFFLTILADLGIANLLIICVFLAIVIFKYSHLDGNGMLYLAVPILGTIAHFNIVGDYFHAPFWIALALVQIMYSEARKAQAEGIP